MTRVHEAVKALALCHNVTPVLDDNAVSPLPAERNGQIELKEKSNDAANIVYQASSPDEVGSFLVVIYLLITYILFA